MKHHVTLMPLAMKIYIYQLIEFLIVGLNGWV
ncbi:Uncharacterised protein [Yersinia massiliensis]|nr:Uncharacterised protein [Yersinia massiliensis]